MDKGKTGKGPNRRQIVKTGFAGALVAPFVIGRAPLASAETSFAGEDLIAVSWSGNYETVFKQTVIDPFNEKYKTNVGSMGIWDQMVAQIYAAPEDKPPFDITVAEESVTGDGAAKKLWLPAEADRIPNLSAVYPYFSETRPGFEQWGVPFAIGTTMLIARKSLEIAPDSWGLLWDERLKERFTADSSSWWWTLSVPALMSDAQPGLDEMLTFSTAEPLFAELDRLRPFRWYTTGAEQANLLNQGEVDAALTYSSDAFNYLQESPGEYLAAVPKEGVSAWTDRFIKVRGTHHSDLADLFLNYLLEKETQDRFLAKSMVVMSRGDVTIPAHWQGYPTSNEALHKDFRLITIDGWSKIIEDYQAYDDRMKLVISRSTGGQ